MEITFQRQSLLEAVNQFIAATTTMDETILVPSLLRDVPLDDKVCRYQDVYDYYQALKTVKNEIEWSLLRMEERGKRGHGLRLLNREVQEEKQETDEDLEEQFHHHVKGLFMVLTKLTKKAYYLTDRYNREIRFESFAQ